MQPIVHLCQTPVLERLCPHLELQDFKALTLVCCRLRDAVSPLIGARFILRCGEFYTDVQQVQLLIRRFHPRRLHLNSSMQLEVGHLPDYLKELILFASLPTVIPASVWKQTVPLGVGVLPSSLEHLELGFFQDQVFVPGILPASLRRLCFGMKFNKRLGVGVLPSNLVSLTLGDYYNKRLLAGVLPNSLQELSFGYSYNQPIHVGVLPSSLQKLVFGDAFNQPIGVSVLPPTLKILKFGDDFNHSLRGHILPDSLEDLELGPSYNWALTARMAALLVKADRLRERRRRRQE